MSCTIPMREFRTWENRMAFEGPVSHQVELQWAEDERPQRTLLMVKPDNEILPDVIEGIEHMSDLGLEMLLEDSMWVDIARMRTDESITSDLD